MNNSVNKYSFKICSPNCSPRIWFQMILFDMFKNEKDCKSVYLQSFGCRWFHNQWSWRESNPRPNEEATRFLHVYPRLSFRIITGSGPPIITLSLLFRWNARVSFQLASIYLHRHTEPLQSNSIRAMSRSST